jgi:4-amino-4-deoxy-L-arabinose transferase-like glycosyltransferase
MEQVAVRLKDQLDFERKPVVELGLLLAITLLAASLRLNRLGDWSLWGDEEFTLRFADDGFRVPFSSTLIFWTVRALGVSEWSGRLVPALIGIATVPVLYLPVRRIFGKSVALVSSLLLAVSTWHLYWSQNVRFYSTLLLFFSLALLTFFLAIEEDRPSLMLASLVFLGLAANERLLALFFVPIAAGYAGLLWFLRFERPRGLRLRTLLVYLVPCLVVTAFFVGPYLLSLDDWVVNFGESGETPFGIVAGIVYYVGLPIVCLGAFGATHQLLQRGRASLLLSLTALTPVLALVALAPFQYTVSRYAFIGLTSWILLASVAIVGLFRQAKSRDVVLAVGVLAIVLMTSLSEDFLYFQYQNGNRGDARAAFQYINQQLLPGDAVVAANVDLGRYYLGDAVHRLTLYDFAAIPPEIKRIWIVDDMSLATLIPQQYVWIRTHAHQVANFDVHVNVRNFVMRVYMYDVPSKTGN